MTTYTFPVLTFTATESVLGEDAQGNEIETQKTYQFRGVEFPNGIVMKLNDSAADEFYADAASVQATGLAQVTGFKDSGVVAEYDAEEIRAAVEASAREYGKDSIPEEMAAWLEMEETQMPDGQTLTTTAAQARKVWQVWLALAPVAAKRGEGIEIAEGKTPGTVEITTLYAPLNEVVCVVVELDGRGGWASEASAPADFGSADLLTSVPPPAPWETAQQQPKAPTGWHVTWAGSSVCDGPSFEAVGFHPASEENCTAAYVVAPIAFVEEYERRQDPERQYPATRLEAVRAYARSQSWPCG